MGQCLCKDNEDGEDAGDGSAIPRQRPPTAGGGADRRSSVVELIPDVLNQSPSILKLTIDKLVLETLAVIRTLVEK